MRRTRNCSSRRACGRAQDRPTSKAYNRQLRDLIAEDRAKPSFLVSHNIGLDGAPDAHRYFDQRDEGWTEVVLHPKRGLSGLGGNHEYY